MSNRATNLAALYTFQFNVTTSGTPEALTAKKVAATIAFNDNGASPDTITDSGNGFLTAGFQPGDKITVSGSASNDGTYTAKTVTAGIITIEGREALTTEAAAATVKLIAPKSVPDGIGINLKAKYANTGVIHLGGSAESAVNTGGGSFTLRSSESVGMQVSSSDQIYIDATVSGEGVEVILERNPQA